MLVGRNVQVQMAEKEWKRYDLARRLADLSAPEAYRESLTSWSMRVLTDELPELFDDEEEEQND